MFERFTPSARQVIVFAQEEARLLRHNAIGTEHLLIGLLRDDVGHGGAALRSFGLTAEAAAARVAEIVPAGGAVTSGQIPYTPRARRVVELADRESLSLGHDRVGTEHLLLAISREDDGVAVRVLTDAGITGDALRDAVRRGLEGPVPDAVADRVAPLPPGPAGMRRSQPFAVAPDSLGVPLAPDARRVVGLALAAALAEGRDALTAADLRAALSSD